MPAAAPAAPPAAPATDVPRHVADLSDIQRCADSKKDDVMDRTSVNTQSWIAFQSLAVEQQRRQKESEASLSTWTRGGWGVHAYMRRRERR